MPYRLPIGPPGPDSSQFDQSGDPNPKHFPRHHQILIPHYEIIGPTEDGIDYFVAKL